MMEAIFSIDTLWYLILCLYIPSCLGLIVIVLLQKGKGVGFAGAFGVGGGSDTVFGPRSSKSLPQKLTYLMAGLFMLLALVMSTMSNKVGKGEAPEMLEEMSGVASPIDWQSPDAAEASVEIPAVTEESTTSEDTTPATPAPAAEDTTATPEEATQ